MLKIKKRIEIIAKFQVSCVHNIVLELLLTPFFFQRPGYYQ